MVEKPNLSISIHDYVDLRIGPNSTKTSRINMTDYDHVAA